MSERYARQLTIPGWDQGKLKSAHVAVVGVGGLGSAALYYLVAAGVGSITLLDGDLVEESNLNRQVLHFASDLGRYKVESASEKLKALNPEVHITPLSVEISADSAEVIGRPDVVVDALDNLEARLIVNEYIMKERIPLVHAAVEGFYGAITTILPGSTPCLACIYPEPKPRSTFPVAGVTPGLLGIMEAAEVLKLLLGLGAVLAGRLLMVDVLNWEFRSVETKFRRDCPVCGGRRSG